ncbi:hypothetical protein SLEP1_g36722 [Rubroshorea leprosula]|uniref:Uncharacterized protein n=1 Tax=Rubroshorea leprosula TaxID=152421 RepID=A0AAV5KSU6_9ROSI|nr:hypothetical protein SLEP1_g36722 [Rubroshorea leprosula]
MVCDVINVIAIENCKCLRRIPLYLPLLDNNQPSLPRSLKQIIVWPQEWWESLEWDHPNAKEAFVPLLTFYGSKKVQFTNIDIDEENTLLMPSVQELIIERCNNLRSLNDISTIKDATELKHCRIRSCQGVQCVLSSFINPLVQKLEVVCLEDLENLEALFGAEAITKSPQPPDTFSSLITIKVWKSHKNGGNHMEGAPIVTLQRFIFTMASPIDVEKGT